MHDPEVAQCLQTCGACDYTRLINASSMLAALRLARWMEYQRPVVEHRLEAAANASVAANASATVFFGDSLFAMAADKCFMSCERVVPTEELLKEGSIHTLKINRMMTHGVVEAPMGAHFTSCEPDYNRDEAFQKEYAATAKDPEAWTAFQEKYLNLESHDAYRQAVEARS